MSATAYAKLKDHFDKLVLGGYPKNTRLEPIRTTYEDMFDMRIDRQDVYETKLLIPSNPISSIITLVGPETDSNDNCIPTGLIGSNESNVHYINHFTSDSFMDNEESNEKYIKEVFRIMYDIMEYDRFAINLYKNIPSNPYVCTLSTYPFYFTYHHAKEVYPNLITSKVFYELLEKYYVDEKDLQDKLMDSLYNSKYTPDTERIYSIMTCKNTISY